MSLRITYNTHRHKHLHHRNEKFSSMGLLQPFASTAGVALSLSDSVTSARCSVHTPNPGNLPLVPLLLCTLHNRISHFPIRLFFLLLIHRSYSLYTFILFIISFNYLNNYYYQIIKYNFITAKFSEYSYIWTMQLKKYIPEYIFKCPWIIIKKKSLKFIRDEK